MSISVDDLVASLSSNHIGQEAMDLAALQAQLAHALYSQPIPSSPNTTYHRRGTHANTPVSCTPATSSFCWDRPEFDRRRSNSTASMSSSRDSDQQEYEQMYAGDEDERMVEDLLFPSSPITSSATPQYSSPQASHASPSNYNMPSRKASFTSPYSTTHYDLPPNASIFATTDPFYLAQLQAAQKPAPSFFSQFGNPTQQSPFLKGHSFTQLAGTAY